MTENKLKRRWFRFSLWTLFVLTLVAVASWLIGLAAAIPLLGTRPPRSCESRARTTRSLMQQSLVPSAKMRAMRFQFSLATLLVCVTVLAVVAAIAALMPVRESRVSGMRVLSAQMEQRSLCSKTKAFLIGRQLDRKSLLGI